MYGFAAEMVGLTVNAFLLIALFRLGLSKLGVASEIRRLLVASFAWFSLNVFLQSWNLSGSYEAPELWGFIYACVGALFGTYLHLLIMAISDTSAKPQQDS